MSALATADVGGYKMAACMQGIGPMPLYTYTCQDHGEFSAWGKMAESDNPQPCPTCAELAPRALARPAIAGGRDVASAMGACGMGACGESMGAGPAPAMGGCCGGGACVH